MADHTGAYLDQIYNLDESSAAGLAGALNVLQKGIQDYQARLVALINAAPGVDMPLVLAAMKLTYEGLLASLPASGQESVRAILELPFKTVTYQVRGGGHG